MGFLSKAFGTLFGKKSTPVQVKPTAFQSLPQFGQDLAKDIVDLSRGYSGRTDLFAPADFQAADPFQSQAIARLGQGIGLGRPQIGDFRFGQRASEAFGRAGDMIGQGAAPITGEEISTGISNFFNPYVEQALQPQIRSLMERGAGQLSDVRSLASDVGGFGGTRQALREAEIERGLRQEESDILGRGYSDAFSQAAPLASNMLQADRSRMLTGAGQQAGLGSQLFQSRLGMADLRSKLGQEQRQAELQDIENMLRAGGLRRGFGQEYADYETGLRRVPLQQLGVLQNAFGMLPTGGGDKQLRENKGALTRVSEVAKNFGQAYGAAMSDRRTKENIKHIGVENGYPIYEFNYIGEPERYSGVMAQDIEILKPEAVHNIDGILHVDYSQLGVEMRRVQ